MKIKHPIFSLSPPNHLPHYQLKYAQMLIRAKRQNSIQHQLGTPVIENVQYFRPGLSNMVTTSHMYLLKFLINS